MRSFSNIMPNFANSLHLLVDCIREYGYINLQKTNSEKFCR